MLFLYATYATHLSGSRVLLGLVATVLSPYPFRSAVRSEPDGTIAVVQLQEAKSEFSAATPFLANLDGRYDRYLLQPQDLLVRSRGHFLAALVNVNGPSIAAPGLHVLRPRVDRVLPSYLVWCLNHPKVQATLQNVGKGTHAPFVSKQTLANLDIPVPSILQQERIVEVWRRAEIERSLEIALALKLDELVDASTWQLATASCLELPT